MAPQRISLGLVLILLIFPVCHQQLNLFSSKPLYGYYVPAAKPEFSWDKWFSAEYQHQLSRFTEDSIGLKSDLVRLYNQLDYSLFREVHAARIRMGKNQYLFGDQMIDTWTGKEYLGRNYIRDKVGKLKELQQRLLHDQGVFLLFVMAPDKANFYPEYIPERFRRERRGHSNYSVYLEELEKEGVDFIDFNRFFRDRKDTSTHVLFPKLGSHWSLYGALLAADSVGRYLETKTGKRLPRLVIDSLHTDHNPRGDDADVARTLNLIWDIPQSPLTYATFHMESGPGAEPLHALFIGDSFYWQWYNQGIISGLFRNNDFWYYCTDAYPAHFSQPSNAWNVPLREVMNGMDAVILLQGMAGSGKLGYGFVDRAYEVYCGGDSAIRVYEALMRKDPKWLDQVKQKAVSWKVGLDAAILIDAIYLRDMKLQQENPSETK